MNWLVSFSLLADLVSPTALPLRSARVKMVELLWVGVENEWGRPEVTEDGPKEKGRGALVAALHDAGYEPRRNRHENIR